MYNAINTAWIVEVHYAKEKNHEINPPVVQTDLLHQSRRREIEFHRAEFISALYEYSTYLSDICKEAKISNPISHPESPLFILHSFFTSLHSSNFSLTFLFTLVISFLFFWLSLTWIYPLNSHNTNPCRYAIIKEIARTLASNFW